MATVSKTFTENHGTSSYRTTWTITLKATDIIVSDNTFTLSAPTCTAKFTGYSKTYYDVEIQGDLKDSNDEDIERKDGHTGIFFMFAKYDAKGKKNTTYTIPIDDAYPGKNIEIYTNRYFNSSNKTIKTLNFNYKTAFKEGALWLETATDSDFESKDTYYASSSYIIFSNVYNITLDAPPIISGELTYNYYFRNTTNLSDSLIAGQTDFVVNYDTIAAQYGGDITSIKIVGFGDDPDTTVWDETSHTARIPINTFGIFENISLEITDSRGQITTQILDTSIEVKSYELHINSASIDRVDNYGIINDEGINAALMINVSGTNIPDVYLSSPEINIKGYPISSSVVWYYNWDENRGFDNPIDWEDHSSLEQLPKTLYCFINGPFSFDKSYRINIIANTKLNGEPFGNSGESEVSLPQAFYTFAAAKGGHLVGIGKKPEPQYRLPLVQPTEQEYGDGSNWFVKNDRGEFENQYGESYDVTKTYYELNPTYKEDGFEIGMDTRWYGSNGNIVGEFIVDDGNFDALSLGTNLMEFIFDKLYPVNSIYIGNTIDQDPNNFPGMNGKWTLVDKEFKTQTITNAFTAYSTNTSAINDQTIILSGHTIWIRFQFVNKVAIEDTSLRIAQLSTTSATNAWNKIGLSAAPYTARPTGWSDGGNVAVMFGVFITSTDTYWGGILTYDIVGSSSVASGSTFNFNTSTRIVNFNNMLDSFCDKFYWQRTE